MRQSKTQGGADSIRNPGGIPDFGGVRPLPASNPGVRINEGHGLPRHLPRPADGVLPVLRIRERRLLLSQAVEMVGHRICPSLIVVGQPGLGKTHEVTRTLQAMGMEPDHDYRQVQGYTSPRGLFETLFDNRLGLTLLDDCDAALNDPVAVGLLKAALDSHQVRTINWVTAAKAKDLYPKSFRFDGGVIFISNRALSDIDPAVHSRSLVIDYHMSREEILEHMESILPLIKIDATPQQRRSALHFVRQWEPVIRQLNLRTLVSVLRIIKAHPTNWEPLAIYTVTQ